MRDTDVFNKHESPVLIQGGHLPLNALYAYLHIQIESSKNGHPLHIFSQRRH